VQAFDLAKLALGLYGLFGAVLLSRWITGAHPIAFGLLVAPAFLSSTFFVVVVHRLIRFTSIRSRLPAGSGELEEVCLYLGAVAFTWLVWRRVRLSALLPGIGRAQAG
jgi:hypothetical protein